MAHDHGKHNHGLYLLVQPISDEISVKVLEDQITAALPPCPENEAYLTAITTSAAPLRVKRQRLTAMACLLSLLGEVCPAVLPSLCLYRDEKGRPHAKTENTGLPAMDFNLTHTEGLVACALLLGNGRVGVDIEAVMPTERAQKLSRRFFTISEQAHLASLSKDDMAMEATRIWTVKEALSKQDGRGYPLAFDSLCLPDRLALYHTVIQALDTARGTFVLSLCAPEDSPAPRTGSVSLPLHLQRSL